MNNDRKKELIQEYKHRRPDMGILAIECKDTGDVYYHGSKDTKADMNGHKFRLDLGSHPNRELQSLWKRHGADGFSIAVAEVVPYDDEQPNRDDQAHLDSIRDRYIAGHDKAARLLPNDKNR